MSKRIYLWLAEMLVLLILCGLGWLIIHGFNRGSLLIEAQIVRPSGETQAVAGETFYLLDADMIGLAMIEGNERSPLRDKVYMEHPNLGMVAMVMDARRRSAYSLGAEVMPFMESSRPLWESHVIQSAQTDKRGHAFFKNLKPGDYWLLGDMETVDGAAFWNLPISIGRLNKPIKLDQNNALYMRSD
jgi:hypothetical protein